jgi:predicted NAD/FAD-binding protein
MVQGGDWQGFDEVIFATHPDQALAMLGDPSEAERRALGAIRYQPNEAILHCDTSLMPRRRKVWSSWVYVEPAGKRPERISLSYWMNSLQPIPMDDPMFVTLNATTPVREDLIYDVNTFHHPVYDLDALKGQQALRAVNGERATWFCGAWMRNGFHEDGFASAVDVVEAMAARDTLRVAAE